MDAIERWRDSNYGSYDLSSWDEKTDNVTVEDFREWLFFPTWVIYNFEFDMLHNNVITRVYLSG